VWPCGAETAQGSKDDKKKLLKDFFQKGKKKEKPRHSGDIWAHGAAQCFSCRCQDEIARIAWLQTSETTTACIDRLLCH